jgi:hypothetical protein
MEFLTTPTLPPSHCNHHPYSPALLETNKKGKASKGANPSPSFETKHLLLIKLFLVVF